MLPLEGLTVVALEQAVAAPFATRQLADLGARVIKVERPGSGDFARGYDATVMGMASHFAWLNRSKESITLDLKQADAKDVLHRLLDSADIFIHNLAPDSVDRLGFPSHELRAKHPLLIICTLSGYGSSGPYKDRKAYDLLVQGETGLITVTGTPETPSKVGISVADIAGGMYAYTGILTALYRRERTGQGAVIEVSLFEALGEWMGYPAYFAAYGGRPPSRAGASHATIAPYGPYTTADGRAVLFGIQNQREWGRFCSEVIFRPELVSDIRFGSNVARIANKEELDMAIHHVFSELDAEETTDRLEAAGIAHARVNSMQEFWDHPQLRARDRWRDVASPVGDIRALIPPVTMDNVEARMEPIPAVGEQTDSILQSLGFDADHIAYLRSIAAV